MKKILTLCVPVDNRKVLLGMKKRGFGVGLWNGFGGKVEDGESIEEAAMRELQEEVGISDGSLSKAGVLEFSFDSEDKVLEVHIFRLTNFTDTSTESEEMKPEWFSFDSIPLSQMWSSDTYWLPLFLDNKTFEGEFRFDRPSDAEYAAKVLSHRLEEAS